MKPKFEENEQVGIKHKGVTTGIIEKVLEPRFLFCKPKYIVTIVVALYSGTSFVERQYEMKEKQLVKYKGSVDKYYKDKIENGGLSLDEPAKKLSNVILFMIFAMTVIVWGMIYLIIFHTKVPYSSLYPAIIFIKIFGVVFMVSVYFVILALQIKEYKHLRGN